MDVSEISALSKTKKTSQLKSLAAVNISVSDETKKIGKWVEMLKAMPEIRELGAPSRPDPKKIAEALHKEFTN